MLNLIQVLNSLLLLLFTETNVFFSELWIGSFVLDLEIMGLLPLILEGIMWKEKTDKDKDKESESMDKEEKREQRTLASSIWPVKYATIISNCVKALEQWILEVTSSLNTVSLSNF